jgi:hypothetical protein
MVEGVATGQDNPVLAIALARVLAIIVAIALALVSWQLLKADGAVACCLSIATGFCQRPPVQVHVTGDRFCRFNLLRQGAPSPIQGGPLELH